MNNEMNYDHVIFEPQILDAEDSSVGIQVLENLKIDQKCLKLCEQKLNPSFSNKLYRF